MAGVGVRDRIRRFQPPAKTPVLPPTPSQTPANLSSASVPRSDAVSSRGIFIDREMTCPMLLRVFPKVGGHHKPKDFAVRGKEPKNEFQIYTWKDATLRELTELVIEVVPEAKRRDAWLSMALVFPDREGFFVIERVGKTFAYCSKKVDDDKSLAQLGFQIGDYLDVAIFHTTSALQN